VTGPVEGVVFSETFKELSKPILRKTLDNGSKLINELKGDFSIEGQEVTFLCPENLEKWNIVFKSKKGLFGGKKKFLFPSVKKVSVNSLLPYKDVTSNCVNLLPEGGFELSYKNLNENTPYLLEVDFDIEDPRFIDHMVYRKVQDDAPDADKKKYWMQAQLKFTDVFEKMFSNIRLEDLDFDVRVSTHEDIHTSVPGVFRRELEVIVKWMGETDRERKRLLSQEHLALLRARKGGKLNKKSILELLQDLQDIFLPKTFRTFLDVQKDFYYHDCLRGIDYYVAPFPTYPKFMTVITRTNLNLDKPAAEGLLEFHRKDFKSKIEDIFGKYLGI
jgi:hypothetical protein